LSLSFLVLDEFLDRYLFSLRFIYKKQLHYS
jgi:hypothetical protein